MIEVKLFSLSPRGGVEARIYYDSDKYSGFRAQGKTASEALGSLIFFYGPERLGLRIDITDDPPPDYERKATRE